MIKKKMNEINIAFVNKLGLYSIGFGVNKYKMNGLE